MGDNLDAAVQIVRATMRDTPTSLGVDRPRDVVAALARAGWLHDPDKVKALEAEITGLRVAMRAAHRAVQTLRELTRRPDPQPAAPTDEGRA
jgi:hypothetical protein